MDNNTKIKLLQFTYIGILADSIKRFKEHGILDRVTEEKRQEQLLTGARKASMFGISSVPEIFEVLSDLYGCAQWHVSEENGQVTGTVSGCQLCNLARQYAGASPCELYCLQPIEGMAKSMGYSFACQQTLWESNKCKVILSK